MTAQRKLLSLMVVIAALCACAGFGAGRLMRSPAQIAADARPPEPSLITAQVARGTVLQSISARGTVVSGGSISIDAIAPEGIDPVITKRPLRIGGAVRSGQAVVEVSYRPVLVLEGDVPLLRDLTLGDSGPDVTALQEALVRGGWSVADASGTFGESTAGAIRRLYEAAGYPAPTATDAPVATDEGADLSSPSPSPHANVLARKSELTMINQLPGSLSAVSGRVGSPAAENVVTISTAPPTVNLSIAPAERPLVQQGDRVQLSSTTPPYRSSGRVIEVGRTSQDPDTKAFAVPVSVRPKKTVPDGAMESGLEVRIDVSHNSPSGLIVPIAAIYTSDDGTTNVVKVVSGQTFTVPVRILETGTGRARVAPSKSGDLEPGDAVRIGSVE